MVWSGTQCIITGMLLLILILMSMLDKGIGLGDAYSSFHVRSAGLGLSMTKISFFSDLV